MIATYADAQKYLESLIPNTFNRRYTNLRLERIEHLLTEIGNPHHSFKSIHVGGTSGKGSTAYLISKILAEAGYHTGLHISPHLQKINERMQIHNQQIDDTEFITLINWIKPYVQKVGETNPFGTPSYFEVLVAISFEYFRRKKVTIAVVEVGLGGTLDATNVICPLVSVITNIDLDHTEILGHTIEKIAVDKAGIIKKNTTVITAAAQPTVIKILQKKCREQNARLLLVKNDIQYNVKKVTTEGSLFDISTPEKSYHHLKLSLLGRHQLENAACALLAVDVLKHADFTIAEDHIRNALTTAHFPGRMEIVRRDPTIVLDGAHNPAKMRALIETMKELFDQKIIAIVGFKKKKDIISMINELSTITKQLVLTRFSSLADGGPDLSEKPSDIAEIVKKYHKDIPYQIIPIAHEALQQALTHASTNDILLVTGSLYLVGEARQDLFFQLPKGVEK